MMRPSNDLPEVYLCRDIVDFRKGINGLAILVEAELERDPFSEHLFVFCNRKHDKVKILYWERNGYCLWQKSLERAKFKWPRKAQDGVISMTGQQLNWLLDGYDVMAMQAHKRLHYHSVL
ncbi:MAG: IS66 family insertion sequence element accessory protein TnpB [Xanthomonadales bacterium]|nr:IS66 family insertion sequence element accessory protein TnpB [Xanthomonadales bacterium]